MRIALLGAMGFVGRRAAAALAGRPEVDETVLVDYDIRGARKLAKALSPKCRWAMADVGRVPDLERLLGNVDAVANASGPCALYERTVLLTCARAATPAASIGDGPLPADHRREIHDAFLESGAAAVSGCGLMPGWTELLAAHFLVPSDGRPPVAPTKNTTAPATGPESDPSRGAKAGPVPLAGATGGRPDADRPQLGEGGPVPPKPSMTSDTPLGEGGRFLFWSPAVFGGYAFFRRAAADPGTAAATPPGAPPGTFRATAAGDLVGLPPDRPAALFRRIRGTLSPLGALGSELSAAFLFWLRGRMTAPPGTPAAVAGVFAPGGPGGGPRSAAVTDAGGGLAGLLLAETAVLLARRRGLAEGLLPLPALIGREDASRIAASGGGAIVTIP